jgi:acyl-CoA reductase-like NAD-dependent aldehyde dehydrogenase
MQDGLSSRELNVNFKRRRRKAGSQRQTYMKVINPATEELIREIEDDSKESVLKKFNSLRAAQLAWTRVSLLDRIKVLKKFSSLLEEQIEELAATLTDEVGKPLQQSRNEINGARARIKWMTEHADQFLTDEQMTADGGMLETISYEPLGVICNISAWNYPFLVGVNVFVPALLAGNTVLYKPSEFATLTGLNIERLLKASGVPADVFHIAIGGGATGELLLDIPFDGYFFTGSVKTGKYIYEKVAPKMVPCQLELGGKDPLYVADDVADVKSVAAATADGAFYNNGQSCCAVERIYVHEKVYDRYVEEFVNEVKSWKSGAPTEDGVYIGPLTRKDQLALLEKQVAEAATKGAKIAAGGKRMNKTGYYFEPTVLTDVNHQMSVMREESFGPIIGIMKVRDDDEAVRLMNDTDYGLTASVYSRAEDRAKKILRQINSGTGYWNCCDRVSAAVPWSGRKNSGFGSTLSHVGLRAFTRPKAYHLKTP